MNALLDNANIRPSRRSKNCSKLVSCLMCLHAHESLNYIWINEFVKSSKKRSSFYLVKSYRSYEFTQYITIWSIHKLTTFAFQSKERYRIDEECSETCICLETNCQETVNYIHVNLFDYQIKIIQQSVTSKKVKFTGLWFIGQHSTYERIVSRHHWVSITFALKN